MMRRVDVFVSIACAAANQSVCAARVETCEYCVVLNGGERQCKPLLGLELVAYDGRCGLSIVFVTVRVRH